ncbi:MAG: 16S rRNA (adenine(1518)-N(6)/adenine(1519)-N(6))-dimethyltransferase RsmA, partial [Minisyncoccia bacterium]
KSETALRKIVGAGEIKISDVILEIGPGKGALTEKLLQSTASQVVAIEKDRELFEFLKNKFSKEIRSKKLILLNEDILGFNMGEEKYKITANIPYNITGAILKKFLTAKNQPGLMVLMVQHEVARRIMATDKKESILSISVRAYGEPKLLMKVGARYFSPAPKVDSAILVIKNISRKLFKENNVNEAKFWEIVKAGFAHKRKKLSSNLKNLSKKDDFIDLGGLENKRAEDLALSGWILLAQNNQ